MGLRLNTISSIYFHFFSQIFTDCLLMLRPKINACPVNAYRISKHRKSINYSIYLHGKLKLTGDTSQLPSAHAGNEFLRYFGFKMLFDQQKQK